MEIESKVVLRRTFGNLKCFWFIDGYPKIVIGPHCICNIGPLFLCFFTTLLLLGIFLVFYVSAKTSSFSSFIGFILFTFLLVSYFCAATVDPGIEMVKSQDDDISALDSSTYCSVCDVYMKPRTEHCKECEVCIQEYDHHCPWTSKCIGKGNLMFFYMFLSSLFIAFIYGIFTMAAQQRLPKNL